MSFFKKKNYSKGLLSKDISEYSVEFQSFWNNFIIEPMSLIRSEVNTDFLLKIEGDERSLMLQVLRNSLNENDKKFYMIEALALLKDKDSVEALSKLLKEQTEIEWKLRISKALYSIGENPVYFQVLQELIDLGDSKKLSFYQHLLLDLKNEKAVSALIRLLNPESGESSFQALTLLNSMKTGARYTIADDHLPYNADYFLERRDDIDFLKELAGKI